MSDLYVSLFAVILAPTSWKFAFVNLASTPAPSSMFTFQPFFTSAWTAVGEMATLLSLGKLSLGTPTESFL
ncbi:hypothetical protein DPMN_020980 [Dreissena polymorpha]|uniref:Uncharacterized protein n=1 Tax=Dreissena polymorpha TaxID=45954 RepID=A0A9D4NN30_DREPO|nr:hypothetical protein DPMN_020980 [Dreissena polymorpha]